MGGKIQVKSIRKLLKLCSVTLEKNKMLSVDEIADIINISRGHAYNYKRALSEIVVVKKN